jgi:hypothetical protein
MNYPQYPRLMFDDSNHTYKWDGIVKPSVTQVLSRVSVNEKPICDNRFFRDDPTASDFGKAFHKVAAMLYNNESPSYPPSMVPWIDSFLRFQKEYSFLIPVYFKFIKLIETPLYHETLGYCLTPDIICEAVEPCPRLFKNAIVTLDWKTAVQEMDYWRFQTAGYSGAVKSLFPNIFQGRHEMTMAVRFDEKTYHTATRTGQEVKSDWNYFLSTLNVYKGAA